MLSLQHVLDWRAERHGDAPALSDDLGASLTYAALHREVERSATGFAELGVAPFDVVPIIAGNSLDWIVSAFGLVRLGAIPAGVSWRMTAPELTGLFAVLDPAAVVADADAAATVAASGFTGRRLFLARPEAAEVPDDTWARVRRSDATPPPRPVERLRPEAPFVLIHTSGTTGRPKVVPVPHRTLLGAAQFLRIVVPDAVEGARHLTFLPLFHLAGLANLAFGLYSGGWSRFLVGFDPVAVVDDLEAHRIQFTNMVPTVLRLVLDELRRRDPVPTLPDLVEIAYGAAPMPPELLRDALGTLRCRFRQHYSASETGPLPISSLEPADHDPSSPRLASSGRVGLGWEVRIADAQDRPLGTGEVGEIQVRGSAPIVGYWNDAAASAAAMTADGFYRTGDAGHLDGDGYLTLVDRVKDMIISGGENVYPAEVEAVLRRHRLVDQVAVIGVPDERWGETVLAVIVPTEPPAAPEEAEAELVAFVRANLAGFKCPRRISFVDGLPVNASGKIAKRELRARHAAGR